MSLPILTILEGATGSQLVAARHWVADNLHIPVYEVRSVMAVAYIVRHFQSGQLEGWDGFITDLG